MSDDGEPVQPPKSATLMTASGVVESEPVGDTIDSGISLSMKMPTGGADHGHRLYPERFGTGEPLG